ncbi:MAG: hypothetical protein QOG89_2490, partial [Thermomicrobiales bacterium]|nr:hypothetical protein [Thermomicrobiales bacterium]
TTRTRGVGTEWFIVSPTLQVSRGVVATNSTDPLGVPGGETRYVRLLPADLSENRP